MSSNFISNEWQSILERASRAAGGFATLEARFEALERYTMSVLEDLQAQVKRNTSVVSSAALLIAGLSDKLKAALKAAEEGNAKELEAFASELSTSSDALAAAIAANTVAAPEVPAEPAPAPVTDAPAEAPVAPSEPPA